MKNKISLKIVKVLIVLLYLLLFTNFMYWIYYFGHYVFKYEIIDIKFFDFPHSNTIITICLVVLIGLFEEIEKKLEKRNLSI